MAIQTYNSRKTRVRINKRTGKWETHTAPEKDGEWIEFEPFNYDGGNETAKHNIVMWLDSLDDLQPDENDHYYIEAPLTTRTKEVIVAGEGNIAFVYHKLGGQREISLANLFGNANIEATNWQRKEARPSKEDILRGQGFTGNVSGWSSNVYELGDKIHSLNAETTIEVKDAEGNTYSCGLSIYTDTDGDFGFGFGGINKNGDHQKPIYEWHGNFDCVHKTREEAENACVNEFWDTLHELLTAEEA